VIYVLPFFIGVLIVFSAITNGQLAQEVGIPKGIQMNFFFGSLSAFVLTLAFEVQSVRAVSFTTLPIIFLCGSFFAMGVLFFMNTIVPKISAFYIVLLPFVGQMLVSGCIDYFYLNILSRGKIIGAILILIGIMCNAILERASVTS